MATDHGTFTCGVTADKAPRFLVPWDFSVLRLSKKVVCLAQRLNNLGSVFQLTLGGAIPLGVSLSI